MQKDPREWQKQNLREFTQKIERGQRDYLLEACPAAGKTRAVAMMTQMLAKRGLIDRVVFLGPTLEVCRQAAEPFAALGIQLGLSGPEQAQYHGCAVTYHSLNNTASVHRKVASEKRTLAIFDEVHHVASDGSWGSRVEHAFAGAAFRVRTSGTLFRTDNREISGVRGDLIPDFRYTYAQALADVDKRGNPFVRKVVFPAFNSEVGWVIGGRRYRAALTDAIPDQQEGARLQVVLKPDGEFIRQMLLDGWKDLEERRRLKPNGGILIPCIDHRHAHQVARRWEDITGDRPAVVLCDTPKAADAIEAFRKGNQRCLVTVRVVSEGVDIERLVSILFLTNIQTEMSFRQLVGRTLRAAEDPENVDVIAGCRIPASRKLMLYAERMLQDVERGEALRRQREEATCEGDGQGRQRRHLQGTSTYFHERTIFLNDSFTADEIRAAEDHKALLESPLTVEEIAMRIRRAGCPTDRPTKEPTNETPLVFEHSNLEKEIDSLVGRAAHRLLTVHPSRSIGEIKRAIHTEWVRITGVGKKDATVKSLLEKRDWVKRVLSGEVRLSYGW